MKQAFIVLLITVTSVLGADKMTNEVIQLSVTNQLTFSHPEKFTYDVVEEPDDMFRPAMRFRAFGTDGISTLSFKLFAGKDKSGSLKNQSDMDAAVLKTTESYVDGSVEKTNVVHEIKRKDGFGAICQFTDADLAGVTNLRPGQFRNITGGLVKVGDFVFTVRGYSNTIKDDEYKAMIGVLEGMEITSKSSDANTKK